MADLRRISVTFLRLDLKEEVAYPLTATFRYLGVLLPVVVQFFIARLVPARAGDIGSDYFTFSVVGLAVAAGLQMTMEQFGNRLQKYQDQGVLETLLVEPVPWTFVPLAMNAFHVLSAIVATTLILLMGGLLGADVALGGLLPFAAIMLLAIAAGASIGVLSASILVLAKRASPIVRLYGLAASLVGGAVFPLSLLPDWLLPLSYLVPHAYAISAARNVLMTSPPQTQVIDTGDALLGLSAFNLLVLPLGILLFARSLDVARRRGMLGSY